MGRRQDVDVVDQRAAAELAPVVEQGRNPGPLVRVGVVAAHDAFRVLERKGLLKNFT